MLKDQAWQKPVAAAAAAEEKQQRCDAKQALTRGWWDVDHFKLHKRSGASSNGRLAQEQQPCFVSDGIGLQQPTPDATRVHPPGAQQPTNAKC